MKKRPQALVHLNALRAFDAAARHLSFAAAAEELHVTPSAISQQIKVLEDYLGVPLFVRGRTGISLTPDAAEACTSVRAGLAQLAAGLDRMQGRTRDRAVTLTVPTSFASKWLLPRLDDLRRSHPDLELRLDTTNGLADYAADGIDLGVRYGLGGYAGVESVRWLPESVFPVCSPRLLAANRDRPMRADLARLDLIHDDTIDFDPEFPTWARWFAANGGEGADASRGLRFNSTVLAVQAAIDGQGVLLGRSVIVQDDLRAGRLVRAADGAMPTRCHYHLLHRSGALVRPPVRAVHDWLVAQATPSG